MSNPYEYHSRPDGDGPRPPGRELYRLWRASQQPIPVPSGNSAPEHIASQDLQQSTSQSSVSISSTLTDSVSTAESNELRLALLQQSLAHPLEASFYTPATSVYDSIQADQLSNLTSSQRSFARRLEEVTYAQDTSPPLSEPASTRTNSSTQSSGPYMPPAFLHYQQLQRVRSMQHGHGRESPTAHSRNSANSEGSSSIHSLSHPVEECRCWDADSPPMSLLAEDIESPANDPMTDETIFPPIHNSARSLEEVDYAPEHTDPDPISLTNSTTSDATTWFDAAQALHDVIQQLEIYRNPPSPIPRPTPRRQTLAAMRRHRFGRRARYFDSPPSDSSPELDDLAGTLGSAQENLVPLPRRLVPWQPEDRVGTESTQPEVHRAVSRTSHSSGAGHTPQDPRPDQSTVTEVHSQVRPAWRDLPLTRQQLEQLERTAII